ncbi:hypothetical protein ACPZ19_02675 [Amycolatopsis lurida]
MKPIVIRMPKSRSSASTRSPFPNASAKWVPENALSRFGGGKITIASADRIGTPGDPPE